MGVYVVTGSASGMGRATAEQLRWAGHQVIGVDLRDAEVVADLSTAAGRSAAVQGVLERSGGRLDGAVLAAGLGGMPGREKLIAEVNYLGVVELLEGLHESLAAAGNAKVVLFSSNSTTTMPGIPNEIVDAFLARDIDRVLEVAAAAGEAGPNFVYGGSKLAVTHWLRQTSVDPAWVGAGIRLNAIAPGAIMTPLLEKELQDPAQAAKIKAFPVPVGDFGTPAEIAQWVVFMLSPAANFLCGTVIYVDGGTDAFFRTRDWPAALEADRIPEYRQKMVDYAAQQSAKA